MKVLILGGNGMLGHKLWQIFQDRFNSWVTVRSNYAQYARYQFFSQKRMIGGVDVFNFDSVIRALAIVQPDVVVNAIGIVKQPPAAKEPIITLPVNSLFPHRLAQLCNIKGFRLIHISTDCVFSGRRGMYTEDDLPDPVDLYGRSKLLGELTNPPCLTLRTSIIGRELVTKNGLVEWFLSNRGGQVKGYTSAIYSGFPTIILAQIIADLIDHYPNLSGLYHVSSDPINKYELLCLLRQFYNLSVKIDQYPDFHCNRSLNSERFREATNFTPLTWPEMVQVMAADPTSYD